MSMLVQASLADASQADRFLGLLDGASSVLGAKEAVEVKPLGTFAREARGKQEILCSAIVTVPQGQRGNASDGRARDLECVLKAMLSAGGLGDCEVRVFDGVGVQSELAVAAAKKVAHPAT